MNKTKYHKSISGQGLIEYLILVAIIAVASISVVRVVGANVSVQFANIAKSLGAGNDQQLKAHSIDPAMYSKKDLGNFLKGSTSGQGQSRGQ